MAPDAIAASSGRNEGPGTWTPAGGPACPAATSAVGASSAS